MDDEFKLCWKNFQDNIASGFQNLYDRGDLVDVTLACDGKLLHAHKIVLAICSPYFQEIFITNPCKHPIIILKDVSFNIMCELLEFMYQGVVNVKHTELQSFMKIGQLLQIKGLATNTSTSPASTSSDKSSQAQHTNDETSVNEQQTSNKSNSNSKININEPNNDETTTNSDGSKSATNNSNNQSSAVTINSPTGASSPPISFNSSTALNQQHSSKNAADHNTSSLNHHTFQERTSAKRHSEFNTDSLSIYSRKQLRRSLTTTSTDGEHNESSDVAMEQLSSEEFFMPTIPHISMVESRYDMSSVKRESDHHHSSGASSSSSAAAAAASLRNTFGPAFGLDYSPFYKNSSGSGNGGGGGTNNVAEYPNELYMPNDYSKNFGNHMDIPPIAPGEHWYQGKLEFMLSQRGKPLLVHDGHTFGIQYVRKDKKYWQCNLSRKFNCKARVTTTDTGEIIVTNNEHCHTEIRQHLRKDYQRQKVMMNALINLSTTRYADLRRQQQQSIGNHLNSLHSMVSPHNSASLSTTPNSHMDDVVQNLHDLAKVSGTAEGMIDVPRHEDYDDNEEPLDCGIKSSASTMLEDVARTLMVNKANSDINNLSENDWKCKTASPDMK